MCARARHWGKCARTRGSRGRHALSQRERGKPSQEGVCPHAFWTLDESEASDGTECFHVSQPWRRRCAEVDDSQKRQRYRSAAVTHFLRRGFELLDRDETCVKTCLKSVRRVSASPWISRPAAACGAPTPAVPSGAA